MTCYKDMRFCNGGLPRCAAFGGCPRALTDAVKAQAEAAGLRIAEFLASTSMPCYQTTTATVATKPPDTGQRIVFRQKKLTDERWREEIMRTPRRTDGELALAIGCSNVSIHNARIRLGLPPANPPGVTRHAKYTQEDALRLIKAKLPTEASLHHTSKRLGLVENHYRHLRRRFAEFFKQHGL